MKNKDKILIAFRNIYAGKQMVKKMIFGMTFVVMILLCFVTIEQSYSVYVEDFNNNNIADCYYYTEHENLKLTSTAVNTLINQSHDMQEKYQAAEFSVLCTLRLHDLEDGLRAENTDLVLDGNVHKAMNFYLNQRKYYQNILSENSSVELALYQDGMSVFADKITAEYGEGYMFGCYPNQPGEIMLDDYILDVYGINGIDERLLGTTVSILYADEEKEEALLNDYVLTGIFHNNLFSYRESIALSDHHLEHIYVNLRTEDEDKFDISWGSTRYYFNNYLEYVNHYNDMENLFKLNVSEVLTPEDAEIMLTARGVEYCILYWIMNNMGKLLMLFAMVIGLIITFSTIYIFQFYRDRNAYYFAMLQNIGMEKRDRVWIFSIEMCFVILAASIAGIYLSAIFLLLLNMVTKQVLNFKIVFMLKSSIIAIIVSWLYFGLSMRLAMRKG